MDWLDRIIEQQAAHYGLTVPQYTRMMHDVAAHQELIDANLVAEVTE